MSTINLGTGTGTALAEGSGPRYYSWPNLPMAANGTNTYRIEINDMTGAGFKAENTTDVWVSQSYPAENGQWILQLKNDGPATSLTVYAVY